MERMGTGGFSGSIVEESLGAYRQEIAEVLGPENPAGPQ
jgi:hypothetical protein